MGVMVLDASGRLKRTLGPTPDTILTSTATGTQTNWAPGLNGNTLIKWSGSGDLLVDGLAGGVAGQTVRIMNTGSKVLTVAHQSGSATAGNAFTNIATSAATPIAAHGVGQWEHDGSNWLIVNHVQGSAISVPFSSGNFTTDAGTWTLDSSDQFTYSYLLEQAFLTVFLNLQVTTVAGGPTQLRVAVPGGFSPAQPVTGFLRYLDNGTNGYAHCDIPTALNAYIRHFTASGGSWAASTNQTYLLPMPFRFPVT